MSVTFKELNTAVKELNLMDLDELDVLRSVGVKKVLLEQQFLEEVGKIAEDYESDLTENIINVYNALLEQEEEGGGEPGVEEGKPEVEEEKREKKKTSSRRTKKETPEKKTSKRAKKETPEKKTSKRAKKETPKKAEKKEQPENLRSRYGHIRSAVSGQLDNLLFKGSTVSDIMDTLDIKYSRVMSHIKHLKNDRGLTVEKVAGENKEEDTYTVEESSWEQN